MPFDIATLNSDCLCLTLDRPSLERALDTATGDAGFGAALALSKPTLLANQPIFLSRTHADAMTRIIAAIESVVALPSYAERVLEGADAAAKIDTGLAGVFMGYDFHLGDTGPKLIEINTNAGGGLIAATLAEAHRACCGQLAGIFPPAGTLKAAEAAFLLSFRVEWQRFGSEHPLQTIGIVDIDPAHQYLQPEFVLFEKLFARAGIATVTVDPRELEYRDGGLFAAGRRIDLVYNRLTDFSLTSPEAAALRAAYLARHVAVTPNPRHHALYANKRNLVVLTDPAALAELGVAETLQKILLGGIASTTLISARIANDWWARRNRFFFKPASGYGSKAAYRGDKLTKQVFGEVIAGDYVAQSLVPPSARAVLVDGHRQMMKVDIRNYAYDGQVQLLAARLYQGQTTNFRTPGGGFAPVFVEDPSRLAEACRCHDEVA